MMISKPPICLIDEVAKLKELEAKATPPGWTRGYLETTCIAGNGGYGDVVLRRTNDRGLPSQENIDLICGLRNAASAIFDVLGEIRIGDATALEEIANVMEEAGYVAKAAYVRRYQHIAAIMEGATASEEEAEAAKMLPGAVEEIKRLHNEQVAKR